MKSIFISGLVLVSSLNCIQDYDWKMPAQSITLNIYGVSTRGYGVKLRNGKDIFFFQIPFQDFKSVIIDKDSAIITRISNDDNCEYFYKFKFLFSIIQENELMKIGEQDG